MELVDSPFSRRRLAGPKWKLSPGAKCTLLANRGLCLEQLGKIDEAVESLEAAQQACPSNREASSVLRQLKATQLLGRAVQKAEANEFSRALALFEEAGRLDPHGDGTWLYNKARMLTKLGRTEEALASLLQFKSGLSEDDDQEQTILLPLLGELLCKEERWSEAVSAIDGAIAANLELPASLLFNYGVALLKSGDLEKARRAFDDVIAYFPNYGLAYDALANIDAQEGAALCKRGDFEQAIPKLYAAVRRTPKPKTLYNLALALLKERRAPEAKEQFGALLRLAPKHPHAKEGADAANFMIEGGDYRDAPAPSEEEDGYYDNYPSASVAPQRRIYQIANEKGVGGIASQDDMVQLLSGIEEWVAGALGPLEQRVIALEEAAEAAGGLVGSASEDRAILQMLFDRVTGLEQQTTTMGHPHSYQANYDEDGDEIPTDATGHPLPEFAAQFDAAASARRVSEVGMHAESIDKRVRSLEKIMYGTTTTNPHTTAISGSGLLGSDDEDDAGESSSGAKTTAAARLDDSTAMSVTARMAVFEQRFGKMAAELEAQSKEIERLRDLVSRGSGGDGGRRPPPRGSPFGNGGPANFKIVKKDKKGGLETGANVATMEAPNMLDELKAATKRRAAKRRELGLTLQD